MFKSSSNLIRQASQCGASRVLVSAHSGRALSTSTIRFEEQAERPEDSRQSRMASLLLEIPPEFKIQNLGEYQHLLFLVPRKLIWILQVPKTRDNRRSREATDHKTVSRTQLSQPESHGRHPCKLPTRTQLCKGYRSPRGRSARRTPAEARMQMARTGSQERETASVRRGGHRASHGRAAAGMVDNPEQTTGMAVCELNRHEALRSHVHRGEMA